MQHLWIIGFESTEFQIEKNWLEAFHSYSMKKTGIAT